MVSLFLSLPSSVPHIYSVPFAFSAPIPPVLPLPIFPLPLTKVYVYFFSNPLIWIFFHRKRVLRTTNEIADILDELEEVEEDFDDDMVDKDYVDSGNSDTSDDEELLSKVIKAANRSGDPEIRVYMDPPVPSTGDTDQDSDDSDEPAGKVLHLPRRLLAAGAHKKVKRAKISTGRLVQEADTSDDDIEDQETDRESWSRKNPQLVGTNIPDFSKLELPDEVVASIGNYNAYDFYKLFQTEDYAKMVVEQSQLYGGQKDLLRAAAQVNIDTYRCTEAVLLMSGYNGLPRRKMLWERQPDCFNQLVSNSIRRTQMDSMLACLHFRDNANLNSDGFYKVNTNEQSCYWYLYFILKKRKPYCV
jgi:hypothetical protein